MSGLNPVWRMGLLILAVLVVSTLVVAVLRRAKPQKNFSELAARVKAWWIMAAVFFGAIAVNERFSLVFFGFLSFWALKEYMTLLKTRPADHRALVWAFLAVPVQYVWVAMKWYGMFVIFIPVYMFLFLPMRLVLARETAGFVAAASQIQWGLMAFVFGLSHLAMLLTFPAIPNSGANGRTLLLFLVFVVEMSDVLQFVWGKTLGRHKILPTVSPNKTWEGFLGGIITTSIASLVVGFLTPFTPLQTIGVALLLAVAGFAGGAVMSAVKRDFGVKDFGELIPGHGGMLDRLDSLCYAGPVFFHLVRYFYY
ncbi:MAG: phosphatidate cytidylyltransferase [Verrucomicrobia bacterium]|nr:MAG: phosphatidate cytidylyltransferase [Verrucomicrobiota bacterium]